MKWLITVFGKAINKIPHVKHTYKCNARETKGIVQFLHSHSMLNIIETYNIFVLATWIWNGSNLNYNLLISILLIFYPIRDTKHVPHIIQSHGHTHTHTRTNSNEFEPNATSSSSFLTLVHLLLLRFRRNASWFFFLLTLEHNFMIFIHECHADVYIVRWQCVTFAWFHIFTLVESRNYSQVKNRKWFGKILGKRL